MARPRPSRATLAATVAASVAAASAVLVGAASPAAATIVIHSQSIGRFLDGAAGGKPIQQIVDLHDARAKNPGTVTDQNPLDITVGGQGDIPLTGKLQFPGSGNVIHFGAANQVAKALSNGFSYGASGAIANSGGASVGGNNNAYPADASFDLSAAAFPSAPIPLPGGSGAPALGGLTGQIGAVSALASTPVGFNKGGSTAYNIGSLKLVLASPALGGVLQQLANALQAPAPPGPLPAPGPPASCSFTAQALPALSLSGGAVVINPTSGSITIDVEALLHALGADINNLPSNTDLLAYVLTYLSSPNGLGKGIQDAISNTFTTQKANFEKCLTDFSQAFPGQLSGIVKQAFDALTAGQTQVTDAINNIIDKLASAGGSNPFQPLVDGLKKALDIGVNVQPHAASHGYNSPLSASPDQADAPIPGQTVVRAIEVDLGGGQFSLALANAGAGPSTAVGSNPPPSSAPPAQPQNAAPNNAIPTGVPAGQAPTGGGVPTLPLVLLALAVVLAGAGAVAWYIRPRIRPNRH